MQSANPQSNRANNSVPVPAHSEMKTLAPAKRSKKNAPPGNRPMVRLDSKELNPTENQTAVGATETKVILQSVFNLDIARGIGAIVQIAFGILVV